jgi:hypothetical protein
MAEECRPDRAGHKADGVNRESLQGADQRIESREIQFRKDEPGHLPVEQESYASIIVPTVLTTTARRSCAQCSASDRPTLAISAVVIASPPRSRRFFTALNCAFANE